MLLPEMEEVSFIAICKERLTPAGSAVGMSIARLIFKRCTKNSWATPRRKAAQ